MERSQFKTVQEALFPARGSHEVFPVSKEVFVFYIVESEQDPSLFHVFGDVAHSFVQIVHPVQPVQRNSHIKFTLHLTKLPFHVAFVKGQFVSAVLLGHLDEVIRNVEALQLLYFNSGLQQFVEDLGSHLPAPTAIICHPDGSPQFHLVGVNGLHHPVQNLVSNVFLGNVIIDISGVEGLLFHLKLQVRMITMLSSLSPFLGSTCGSVLTVHQILLILLLFNNWKVLFYIV